jgi:hypothetical protein
MRKLSVVITAAVTLLMSSCNKTEDLPVLPLSDYFPLTAGKYVTYNLDSIVYYTNFNVSAVSKSYQVKLLVDAPVTDAQGRPAWRIIRSIRTGTTGPFTTDNVFMAVNTGNTIEFIENNLRFIKLASPIRQDYTWQGNRYIDVSSLGSQLKYLDGWDYTYDSINVQSTIGSLMVDNTIKVAQIDNETAIDRTFSEEKYAKGIGLVYRHFHYWNKGTAGGTFTDNSYGVIMKMIDHN